MHADRQGWKEEEQKNGSRDASDVTKGTEVRAEKIQSKTGGVKIQNKERTKMVLVSLQSFFFLIYCYPYIFFHISKWAAGIGWEVGYLKVYYLQIFM